MKYIINSLIIILLFALNGCAYTPSKQELESSDYGNKPNNIEASIRNNMLSVLKDPDSLKITNITVPKKDWFLNPANFNTKFGYGWHVCAMINAKNSYGAYVGYKEYHFFFRGEDIVYYTDYSLNSGRKLTCI